MCIYHTGWLNLNLRYKYHTLAINAIQLQCQLYACLNCLNIGHYKEIILPLEEMACRTRWSLFERLSSELGLVFSVQMEGNNDHGRLHTTSRPALHNHAAVHKITKEFNSLPISI